MKLEKAIEIAQAILRNIKPGDPQDDRDALKLLIQAGKRLMQVRKRNPPNYYSAPLPAEEPDQLRPYPESLPGADPGDQP